LRLVTNLEQDEDEEEFIHNRNTQPETPVSCRDKCIHKLSHKHKK